MYLDTLETIRGTRSRNDKISLIKGHNTPDLRSIMYYAYHPLKHYHIRQLPYFGQGEQTLGETDNYWVGLLEKLASGVVSGQAAKSEVKKFMESLTKRDAELFKLILKKDLRAGFSAKTINAAFNDDFIPIFGAMLAKPYDNKGINASVYMSLKLDGLRAIFKEGILYTRNGHKIYGVGHITSELSSLGSKTIFDGELMIPGMHFQESSGLIRSHNKCPDAIYHIFDAQIEDQPFSERYDFISNLSLPPSTKLVRHILTRDEDKIFRTYDKAIEQGYEGLVLKTPNHKYQMKRSGDWQKLKEVLSLDLTITGIFEGQGKYEGSLGGVIVDNKGVLVKVGGGFSDALRDKIWTRPIDYIGKVAEVLYHEQTPDGSLRHPRLKCFRVDKD